MAGLRNERQRLPLLLLIRCPVFARLCLTLPLAVILKRFLIPLCVFIFGIVYPVFLSLSACPPSHSSYTCGFGMQPLGWPGNTG